MSAADSRSGSARVSRVGGGVAPSRTSVETNQTGGARYSRRRLPHFERPWAIYAVTVTMKSGRCLSPKGRTIVLNSLRHFPSDRDLKEKFHYILRNPWDSGVAKQNEDYPWVWTQHDEGRNDSSFRRDAETSTRDACATQRRAT